MMLTSNKIRTENGNRRITKLPKILPKTNRRIRSMLSQKRIWTISVKGDRLILLYRKMCVSLCMCVHSFPLLPQYLIMAANRLINIFIQISSIFFYPRELRAENFDPRREKYLQHKTSIPNSQERSDEQLSQHSSKAQI